MRKRILTIEDDLSIAEIERDFLELEGFDVTAARGGLEGLKEVSSGGYDLILLDVMLPGMDGFEICEKIRRLVDVPVLMVSARMSEADKVRGLGLGADDYIAKPFSPTELVARVKANLAQYERLKSGAQAAPRASYGFQAGEIQIGNIRLNPQARRVYVDGLETEFTAKEFDLLYFLMSNPETVFSKEKLYERIWGLDFGEIKTVAVHINRLREKIEKDAQGPLRIQTVWGAGYRFKL
jgi:DNA-binding response OmpR family regulator